MLLSPLTVGIIFFLIRGSRDGGGEIFFIPHCRGMIFFQPLAVGVVFFPVCWGWDFSYL